MKTYLLSVYQPAGEAPPPELLEPVMREVTALMDEAKSKNIWLFNGGLHEPATASVVQSKHAELSTTDGPYIEAKEHIGGVLVIRVPDLDEALHWAGRLAKAMTLPGMPSGLPIEVRPFSHVGC